MAEAPVAQGNQVAPAPAFVLSPARHDILDYSTTAGAKAFEAAIKPLSEEHYSNCTPKGLWNFLEDAAELAANFGWNISILDITDDFQNPLGPSKNLLKHYCWINGLNTS